MEVCAVHGQIGRWCQVNLITTYGNNHIEIQTQVIHALEMWANAQRDGRTA